MLVCLVYGRILLVSQLADSLSDSFVALFVGLGLELLQVAKNLEPGFLSLFNVQFVKHADLASFANDWVEFWNLGQGVCIERFSGLEARHVIIYVVILIDQLLQEIGLIFVE